MPSINPKKIKALEDKMQALNIKESDIEEKFVRAQGRGGQKLNKTSSCCWLKHTPTGLEVKCQQERSQAMNRFLARRQLVDKIEELQTGKPSAQQAKIDKIRKQKARRSRRSKSKVS